MELENALGSLKTKKSSGYDDISADVLKRVSDEIFVILKHIFNISLAKGVFPNKLNIARVIPIFKKGNNTLVTNYRPISVLPCFSKLLEFIMYNRLYKHFVENNILYQKQFEFQNAHSAEHATLQLVNQITEAFSQAKYTLGIFLGLSKAFDTVNHNILLEKLKAYGIQSENLKWFRSYLSNRKQFILYDDFKTEVEIVKCGAPKGSILGPLLFLIFVNDSSRLTKVLDPVLFADDTNLFCSDNNIRALFEIANQELSQINDWFLANKLSRNVEKTKYMLFHECTDQENIPLKLPLLKMNSNIIERETFLGVILDEHLTWKKYIQLIENKVSKNVGVLYKASKLINSKYLQSINFSFITSYINYAYIAWASTNKNNLKKLFGKQKQAARIIFNQDRFRHARPLLKTLNALNVYQINLLQVHLFMHKIKTNPSPRIFIHQFQTINHKYATQYSRNNFKEPKRETNYAKYCIHARGPVIWNSFLNETEKNILSQHFFKRKIKEKIFEFEEELSYF